MFFYISKQGYRIEAEPIEAEASGRPSCGIGRGDVMRKQGDTKGTYRSRGIGKIPQKQKPS